MVVLAHEFGHFVAARRCGIYVEEFAIGMGPKLLATRGGEKKTVYSLRLIPIGGFCKMLGEDGESHDERAFNSKKISRRTLVMVAGAAMNFLLAFVIFLALVLLAGYPLPTVHSVIDGSPAAAAQLQNGDRITHINGARIRLYEDLLFALSYDGHQPMEVRLIRDNQSMTVTVTPFVDANGEYKIGFYPDSRLGLLAESTDGYSRVGLTDSIATAFNRIIFYIKSTAVGLVRLITRQSGLAGVAGPIGFFGVIDESYKTTIAQSVLSTVLTMLNLCALLSANLGVMNLLPLPALDGGRLIFLALEAIRRKPVSAEREGTVHFVGFVLLMILAVFIAYQDIIKMI